jgi:hypothetical protein
MHEGAERRQLEAVLIHKHHARLSPRLIPGSFPRSAALFLSGSSPFCDQKSLKEVSVLDFSGLERQNELSISIG